MSPLERYVDAQSGGPGKGWFRIVKDPFEARRVINQGKLAVVQGIEISQLFDCNVYNGEPLCSKAMIDEQLEQVYKMGVRQMEIVNKFDNALGGVAGDSGDTGVVTNTGNRYETGHFWDMQTCHDHSDPEAHDRLVAVTSHLPHALANLLLNQAGSARIDGHEPLAAAGGSLRDMTRVAGANPRIWVDIFLENAEALRAAIAEHRRGLEQVDAALASGDAGFLARWIGEAARRGVGGGSLACAP